ncbi:MAG: alpha/beta fold hydrolase [Chitinophagales bacterium]|nr:alpha/beta fold hydrolase [Chitinophagales bacterium]
MNRLPLILLHGALGSSQQLQPIVNLLSTTFDIHLLDLPGHGGRPMPTQFNFSVFQQAILDFMEKRHLEKADFFGYSMGGYAALFLAMHFPEKVNRIMTLGTKFDWSEETAAKEVKQLNAEKILEKVPAFAAKLQSLHAPNDWKSILKLTADMMLELGQHAPLNSEELSEINHPVLLSVGDTDTMAGLKATVQTYEKLTNAQLWVVPNTPHPIEKVDTILLTEMMKRFFS